MSFVIINKPITARTPLTVPADALGLITTILSKSCVSNPSPQADELYHHFSSYYIEIIKLKASTVFSVSPWRHRQCTVYRHEGIDSVQHITAKLGLDELEI